MARPISMLVITSALAIMAAKFDAISRSEKDLYDRVVPLPEPATPKPATEVLISEWVGYTKPLAKCFARHADTRAFTPGAAAWRGQYTTGNIQTYPQPTYRHPSADVLCVSAQCTTQNISQYSCSGWVDATATEYFTTPPADQSAHQRGYQLLIVCTFLIPLIAWIWAVATNRKTAGKLLHDDPNS
jgi:hypothetical protein